MSRRRRYVGRDVVCPYFRREEARALVCMGCTEGQWVRVMFREPVGKARYMRTWCNGSGYVGCPYAQAVEMGEEEKDRP